MMARLAANLNPATGITRLAGSAHPAILTVPAKSRWKTRGGGVKIGCMSSIGSESAFSSKRERRLWAWTAVVVAAIYSTLGLGSALVEQLGSDVLSVWLFLLGCVLVLAAVVTHGLKVRPGGAEVAVALGVAAAYLLVLVRMAVPTERSHLVEYGVVAVLVCEALTERARQGRRVPVPALCAIVIASLIGAIDEGVQLLIPSRVFDPVDIFFNVLAAAMAVTASAALRRARGRGRDRAEAGDG